MSNLTDVDAALLRWAGRFNERQTARVTARSITGLAIKRSRPNKVPTPGEVRERLKGVVQRRPQVMVKISGGGRGMRPIRAHLNYISRNGQLPVETQDNEQVLGQADLEIMTREWQMGGFPVEEISTCREAFNIVLSMPAGTDAVALHRAARDFAKDEFANHQHALVLHTFENDPNRDPSANPHVHLCVKARGIDGLRLNPRKHDIRRWREQFAERLREYGVEAEASSRGERFQASPGLRQAEYHTRVRESRGPGMVMSAEGMARVMPVASVQKPTPKRLVELTRALAASDDVADRKLAVALVGMEERGETRSIKKRLEPETDR